MRGILQGQGGKRYKTNQITGLTATVGWATANTVKLTWMNPTDVNFKGLVIRYKAGSYPTSPADGYAFYDSNDATPVATYTVTGANIVDGTTFYFRAFAYSYIGATRVYNVDTAGAQVTAIPYRNQGIQTFTAGGTFTVPYGVNAIDVFLVGGGGAGGTSAGLVGGGGGGGGYTKTYKSIPVSAGASIPVVVGSGGAAGTNMVTSVGATGGSSSVTVSGTAYTANGGNGGDTYINASGNGGSGGGSGGGGSTGYSNPGGAGGSNGAGGVGGSTGQGTTTTAFAEGSGTVYSGGGGGTAYLNSTGNPAAAGGSGGVSGGGSGCGAQGNGATTIPTPLPTAGTANTGGGGGGSFSSSASYPNAHGMAGGSGIVIIRWGY